MPGVLPVFNDVANGWDDRVFEIELVGELPRERSSESAVHGLVGEYFAPMLGESFGFLGRRGCA